MRGTIPAGKATGLDLLVERRLERVDAYPSWVITDFSLVGRVVFGHVDGKTCTPRFHSGETSFETGFCELGTKSGFVTSDCELENMVFGRRDAAFGKEQVVGQDKSELWGKLSRQQLAKRPSTHKCHEPDYLSLKLQNVRRLDDPAQGQRPFLRLAHKCVHLRGLALQGLAAVNSRSK